MPLRNVERGIRPRLCRRSCIFHPKRYRFLDRRARSGKGDSLAGVLGVQNAGAFADVDNFSFANSWRGGRFL